MADSPARALTVEGWPPEVRDCKVCALAVMVTGTVAPAPVERAATSWLMPARASTAGRVKAVEGVVNSWAAEGWDDGPTEVDTGTTMAKRSFWAAGMVT